MRLQDLFHRLPTTLQNGVYSAYGWRLESRRYGHGYPELFDTLMARQWLSAEELAELQWRRLLTLLETASSQVPYYRRLFQERGLTLRSFQSPADLQAIPILTRQELQAQLPLFSPDQLRTLPHAIVKTSGTTGTGLVLPMSLAAEQEQWAVWWRYRARFGIKRHDWYAHFYGRSILPFDQERPPFWRVNHAGRQILFSGYHLSERNLGSYLDELDRRRPAWIQGYPSLLSILADYILSTGRRLDYTPRFVATGSENLLPLQKARIEEAFGVPCRQHYGTTEAVANISECEHGQLHVDEDFGLIEFLPDEGGASRLVCTGFANLAFPLLRYEIRDFATLGGEDPPCPCGRVSRRVRSLDGRLEDTILTPDGRRIGRLDHIFKDAVHIREAQLIQHQLDEVEALIVPSPAYTPADEEHLRANCRQFLGPDIAVRIRHVERIPRPASGKLRLVVSRLKPVT